MLDISMKYKEEIIILHTLTQLHILILSVKGLKTMRREFSTICTFHFCVRQFFNAVGLLTLQFL